MTATIQTQLHTFLTDNLTDYLALLQEWVGINSFTANKAGVDELGRKTAGSFAELGFAAEYIPSVHPGFGHHLVLTRPGKSGRKIGLVSHLDTVFPRAEERGNNFAWRPDGERIYGPGTVDIKGGTLIIYMMLAALQATLPDVLDDITWIILLDASEEVAGADFGELCVARLGPEALACLIFEGGALQEGEAKVVVARKGMAIFHIEVAGKAAHAGSAHNTGANAILQLADVLQQVGRLTDYERNLTFNVGTITGGTVTNRVPHFAAAKVEMRAYAPEVYQAGVESIMALNEWSTVASVEGDFSCQVSVTQTRKTLPWPRNAATDHLFFCGRKPGRRWGWPLCLRSAAA
ncbi:MAG: M20/M25/M40 family metallo-hydrolase [Chloroflexi bacterium]|nr:M20/M25/M40 family metallo-hydrolase [Chloroflexota bacterium]